MQVTPEMIDAGVKAGEEYKNNSPLTFSPHVGVKVIFEAMWQVMEKQASDQMVDVGRTYHTCVHGVGIGKCDKGCHNVRQA